LALKRRPGKRGRVDEGFIHSVRSQLSIRGKHSDHRAAVEALVDVQSETPLTPGQHVLVDAIVECIVHELQTDTSPNPSSEPLITALID
ncbi:MAG: hypothetical protein ACRD3C_24630, partial [Vicinamibacterales bacterium]